MIEVPLFCIDPEEVEALLVYVQHETNVLGIVTSFYTPSCPQLGPSLEVLSRKVEEVDILFSDNVQGTNSWFQGENQ